MIRKTFKFSNKSSCCIKLDRLFAILFDQISLKTVQRIAGNTINSRQCVDQLKIDLKERLKIINPMKERLVTIKFSKIPLKIHKSVDQLLN